MGKKKKGSNPMINKTSFPNMLQSGDRPPRSNPLYRDSNSLKPLMEISSFPELNPSRSSYDEHNREEHFGTINKPPWQKNKDERNDPKPWDRERGLSGQNNMAQDAFANTSWGEEMDGPRRMMEPGEHNRPRGEDVGFKNRPQEWNEPGMNQYGDASRSRWNDGPAESQRPNWNSGPERPPSSNRNDGQMRGQPINFSDRPRGPPSDWDDGSRGVSRSNWNSGSYEQSRFHRDDGPQRNPEAKWNNAGPSMSNWDDGPRGSFGPNGPRGSPIPIQDGGQRAPYWEDRQRVSPGQNWDDKPEGPPRSYMEDTSRRQGQTWNEGPREPPRPYMEDNPRRQGTRWEEGAREPPRPLMEDDLGRQGPPWDNGPKEPPRPNWNTGANVRDRVNEHRTPIWDDGPRTNRGFNRDDGPRVGVGGNWDEGPIELGTPGFSQDYARRDMQDHWESQKRSSESSWMDHPGGNSRRNRQAEPGDPGWMGRHDSSDVRARPSQDWDEMNPINRPRELVTNVQRVKRALSPERDVWSRLESGDSRNGNQEIKRAKASCDRAIGMTEDVSCVPMVTEQIAGSGVDLREKLSRRATVSKPVSQQSYTVLICPSFHKVRFNFKLFEEIKDRLVRKLHEMAKSDDYENQPQLRFKDFKLETKRLIIVECHDKATADWLVGWYPLGLRIKVRILLPEDLRVFASVAFVVKGYCKEDPEAVKNTLRVQNPGLEVASWQRGTTKLSKKGQLYGYIVGGETLRYLERNRWELFWEMQRLYVRCVGPHNVKPLIEM